MADDTLQTVKLTTAQVEALQEAVVSGEYRSIEAALADALTAWSERAARRADHIAWLKAKIQASLNDPDPDLSEDEVEERLRIMFDKADRLTDAAA